MPPTRSTTGSATAACSLSPDALECATSRSPDTGRTLRSAPATWPGSWTGSTACWSAPTLTSRPDCSRRLFPPSAGGSPPWRRRGGACASREAGAEPSGDSSYTRSRGSSAAAARSRWPCSPTASRRWLTGARPSARSPSGCSAALSPLRTRGATSALRPITAVRLLERVIGEICVDLFANAVAPLWPSALEELDRPVIDPDVLEMDDEPIVARELDTDAQRSQLRDHFLRLAATLREDLVPPLLLGHGPRLAPTRPLDHRKRRPKPPLPIGSIRIPGKHRCRAPTALVSSQGNIRTPGDMPASGRIPTPSSPVKASIPIRRMQLLHFGMLARIRRRPVAT